MTTYCHGPITYLTVLCISFVIPERMILRPIMLYRRHGFMPLPIPNTRRRPAHAPHSFVSTRTLALAKKVIYISHDSSPNICVICSQQSDPARMTYSLPCLSFLSKLPVIIHVKDTCNICHAWPRCLLSHTPKANVQMSFFCYFTFVPMLPYLFSSL